MTKREPLMDTAYFDREIEYDDRIISKFESASQDVSKLQVQRTRLLYDVFKKKLHILLLRYSRGDDISTLKVRFESIVEAFENYFRAPGHKKNDFDSIDDYVTSLWLISLAILFDANTQILQRVLVCIGNEGCDALVERLVQSHVFGRKQTENLLYPKTYETLFDATIAQVDNQSGLMKIFLTGWYKSLKDVYWYESHKRPDGGFFGYWCLEAACAVKVFAMDDQTYRNFAYYPTDLLVEVV